MNRIPAYLKQVINELDADIATKSDVYDELYDHLQMSKQSYMENGCSEEEAESRAIYDFGQSRAIGSKLQMSMFPAKFIVKIVGWCTFILYTLFVIFNTLTGGLVFYQNGEWTSQRIDGYQRLFKPGNMAHTFNFAPFKTIGHYLIQHESYNYDIWFNNTFGNILLFIPLGFLLPILFVLCRRASIIIGISVAVSAMIEIIQYLTHPGIADVDAVLLRAFGALVGLTIYFCIIRILAELKKHHKKKLLN